MRPATVGAIQAERTHLQLELCKSAFKDFSNMDSNSENSTSLPAGTPTAWQRSVAAAEREGAPLEGLDDVQALQGFFASRLASLSVERLELSRHVLALQRQQHDRKKSAQPWSQESETESGQECKPPLPVYQCDHVGQLRTSACGLTSADGSEEILLADIRYRTDLDNASQYAQVASAALKRDQHMIAVGLRLPPRFVCTQSASRTQVQALKKGYSRDTYEDDLDISHTAVPHEAAYSSRMILPKVLPQLAMRWPRAPVASATNAQVNESERQDEEWGDKNGSSAAASMSAQGNATKTNNQVYVIRSVFDEKLEALVPSLVGDTSAGHTALVQLLPTQADEALRAENLFIDSCDAQEISDRLQALADIHVRSFSLGQQPLFRWSEAPTMYEDEDTEEIKYTSPHPLEYKTMEALYTLRFLTTKRCKLQVLHYLNATVSCQVGLLSDEATEDMKACSRVSPSSAGLPAFTCPILHARNSGTTATSCESNTTERDVWFNDQEAGVAVRQPVTGRWLVYHRSLVLFDQLEEELLRVGTYYYERVCGALEAEGRGAEIVQLDRMEMIADLWKLEAEFATTRHSVLLAYLSSYRHATDWGVEDLWGGEMLTQDTTVDGSVGEAAAAARSPASRLLGSSYSCGVLGARRQLRREIVDLCFRRPNLTLEDGYFAGCYISESKSMIAEAHLVCQVAESAAAEERKNLSAVAAAATTFTATEATLFHTASIQRPKELTRLTPDPLESDLHGEPQDPAVRDESPSSGFDAAGWRMGMPGGFLYGREFGRAGERGLWQEGALLACVGSAVAALPVKLRAVAEELADIHQVRSHLDLAELRHVLLQYACVEMDILLKEEAYRPFAVPDREPKDTKFRDDGKAPAAPDIPTHPTPNTASPLAYSPDPTSHNTLPAARGSWLAPSHVWDNAELIATVAFGGDFSLRDALSMVLCREAVVRRLYRSEMLQLVYGVQMRALGWKIQHTEWLGIDWSTIDRFGTPLKPEGLIDVETVFEPSDIKPRGADGPPSLAGVLLQPPALDLEEKSQVHDADHPDPFSVLLAVGSSRQLGGVWRWPPLALSEFTTSPSEQLLPHSLAGLLAIMNPGSIEAQALPCAATAQALHALQLEMAIRHNQILLDHIIRKLDRRRRILMWRAVQMEGAVRGGAPAATSTNQDSDDHESADGGINDLVVGTPAEILGPAFKQTHVKMDHTQQAGRGQMEEHGLLHGRPAARLHHYLHMTRARVGLVTAAIGTPPLIPGHEHLQGGMAFMRPKDVADLRSCRQQLTQAVSHLVLDLHNVKMGLRAKARRNFVEGLLLSAGSASSSPQLQSRRSNVNSRTGLSRLSPPANSPAPALHVADSATEWSVKMSAFQSYCQGMSEELQPFATGLGLAAANRALALLVLGGSGGVGHTWGLKLVRTDASKTMQLPPQPVMYSTPFFEGPEGAAHLYQLLLDYGPLWQRIDFLAADTAHDPDSMGKVVGSATATAPTPHSTTTTPLKAPSSSALSGLSFFIPSKTGPMVCLDQVWHLPTSLQCLAAVAAATGTVVSRPMSASLSPSVTRASERVPAGNDESAAARLLRTKGGIPISAAAKPPGSRAATEAPVFDPLCVEKAVALLDLGAQLTWMMVEVVWNIMLQAALLAPAHHLAQGGDLTRNTTELANHPASHSVTAPLVGQSLYQHAQARCQAQASPFLPGALMVPELSRLLARLMYLAPLKGTAPATAAQTPSVPDQAYGMDRKWDNSAFVRTKGGAPQLALASHVMSHLHKELQLQRAVQLCATARCRDEMLAGGVLRGRKQAWHLLGALEQHFAGTSVPASSTIIPIPSTRSSLAEPASLSHPTPSLNILLLQRIACLRLYDSDRLLLHNQISRMQLTLETAAEDCGVPSSTAPAASVAIQAGLVEGMWVHDRLRDAWAFRALIMDDPDGYPFCDPRDSDYRRRYGTSGGGVMSVPLPLCSQLHHVPREAWRVMQKMYKQTVTPLASTLQATAEAVGLAVQSKDPDRDVVVPSGPASLGKPTWLVASPLFGSSEGRVVESSIVVLKQLLDMQAMTVAVLCLNIDCQQLIGAAAATSVANTTFITQMELRQQKAMGQSPAPTDEWPDRVDSASVLNHLPVGQATLSALARKLTSSRRRGRTGECDTFEFNADELGRWLQEAATCITAEGRAALRTLTAATVQQQDLLMTISDESETFVSSLAHGQELFFHQQTLKIDTQVVDKAMVLLMELSQARRASARSGEEALRAMEGAYLIAQGQLAARIGGLEAQLTVARTNASLMRAGMQAAALDALFEVRREALQRVFGESSMSPSGEVVRLLQVEQSLEAAQGEVMALQSAMTKVQAWFKMRSNAFQTACVKEVIRARAQVHALETSMWESREKYELQHESLTLQLGATQADLELVASAFAKSSADLRHARSSNQRLQRWKVVTAPQVEALRIKVEQLNSISPASPTPTPGHKMGSANHQINALLPPAVYTLGVSSPRAVLNSPRTGSGSNKSSPVRTARPSSPAYRRAPGLTPRDAGWMKFQGTGMSGPWLQKGAPAGVQPGSRSEAMAAYDAEPKTRQQQTREEDLVAQVARLERSLDQERQLKHDVFERLVQLQAASGTKRLIPHDTRVGSPTHAGQGTGGTPRPPVGLPFQADILLRRYDELHTAYAVLSQERAAQERTLTAIRSLTPDLMYALEHGGTAPPNTTQGPKLPRVPTAERPPPHQFSPPTLRMHTHPRVPVSPSPLASPFSEPISIASADTLPLNTSLASVQTAELLAIPEHQQEQQIHVPTSPVGGRPDSTNRLGARRYSTGVTAIVFVPPQLGAGSPPKNTPRRAGSDSHSGSGGGGGSRSPSSLSSSARLSPELNA